MKFFITLLIICVLLLGCEGPEGPLGPVGPTGEQGEDGLPGEDGEDGEDGEPGIPPIIPITGVISIGNYSENPDYARINDNRIDEGDVVQLYFTSDPELYSWRSYSGFYVTSGRVSIYDPDQDALGWTYLILVIKA